jgi:hypothetical protein
VHRPRARRRYKTLVKVRVMRMRRVRKRARKRARKGAPKRRRKLLRKFRKSLSGKFRGRGYYHNFTRVHRCVGRSNGAWQR